MRHYNSENDSLAIKPTDKIIDTVNFRGHYIDMDTVKEKITGIISVSIFAGLTIASIFYFI